MRLLVCLAITSTLLSGCGQNSNTESSAANGQSSKTESVVQSESERLNEWFEEEYEKELLLSPMTLTRLGRKEHYGEIDDFSEEAELAYLERQAMSAETLRSRFNYEALNGEAKVSYDLWMYQIESEQAMAPYSRHRYVFNQMRGMHSYLPNFLINFHKVDDESDMNAYVKRLSATAKTIDELLSRAQTNASEGVRPPRFAYEGAITQSLNLITGQPFDEKSTADSPLWKDAQQKIDALLTAEKIDDKTAMGLKTAAKEALLKEFEPSYKNLVSWLKDDMNKASSEAEGVGSLPQGKAFYDAKLLSNTTLKLSSDEIHELGLKEVARLRADMVTLQASAKFEGSLQDFFNFIKTDPQFFYPNTDEGREGYLDDSTAYLDYIASKLPEYFGLLPKADLIVKRVEAFRERDGAAQHYYSGTPDGSRAGIYYAHLSDMNSMPKNEMEAIAYHEGNPGHHMQISIAQELTGIPVFRTQAGFTAYSEGWALYSELLAKEMGAYENIYTDFGRLVTEIWRAIRLVVDTGIHAQGWTEAQAIQYFKDNSPIAEGQIVSEVHRYFILPGQATSYKIGMLKILELREKARQELGDTFDIRAFHDAVLGGGALPLPILERVINDWITSTKAQ